jgi:hypothetical protein
MERNTLKKFTSFLKEMNEEGEKKLKHLEHAEDHPINAGKEGVDHAMSNLLDVHRKLRGRNNDTKITMKYDGSPSLVFGHHPETGKFFVASKSAFNKNPKLNYNEADIEKNHGHAPGLVEKLKHALKHLPKVMPPRGVYQGDIMHTQGDVKEHGHKVSFTPNTITYSAKKSSPHGKAALASKIGVAVHTAYKGDNLEDMEAQYAPDLSHFGNHKDVHLISTEHNLSQTKYHPEQQQEFNKHMKEAQRLSRQIPAEAHDAIEPHRLPLKTYINSTVRDATTPDVEGFMKHYQKAHQKGIDKVKTDKAKQSKTIEMQRTMQHVMDNKHHFHNMLQLHKSLQDAKGHLVQALSSNAEFDHHIDGKKVKPEGFVVVRNNRPTKLVDRKEFSAANFNKPKPGAADNG